MIPAMVTTAEELPAASLFILVAASPFFSLYAKELALHQVAAKGLGTVVGLLNNAGLINQRDEWQQTFTIAGTVRMIHRNGLAHKVSFVTGRLDQSERQPGSVGVPPSKRHRRPCEPCTDSGMKLLAVLFGMAVKSGIGRRPWCPAHPSTRQPVTFFLPLEPIADWCLQGFAGRHWQAQVETAMVDLAE
ncbi:hypothetical protein [Gemmatimonas sp.]|uniref:hypothetical protein n=1 Tax=Gemmatimonas sp. TaxID=1962908 RepID=UPI003DA47410